MHKILISLALAALLPACGKDSSSPAPTKVQYKYGSNFGLDLQKYCYVSFPNDMVDSQGNRLNAGQPYLLRTTGVIVVPSADGIHGLATFQDKDPSENPCGNRSAASKARYQSTVLIDFTLFRDAALKEPVCTFKAGEELPILANHSFQQSTGNAAVHSHDAFKGRCEGVEKGYSSGPFVFTTLQLRN